MRELTLVWILVPSVGFRREWPAKSGFTLVELVVVLTIAGILATLAAPGLSSFLQSHRLISAANDFVADLSFARSEAVKSGGSVTVCTSVDRSTCAASGNWQNGWIVLVGGAPIRVREPLAAGIAVTTAPSNSNTITYNGQGQISSTTTNTDYTFCTSAINTARVINLNIVGRHTLKKASC